MYFAVTDFLLFIIFSGIPSKTIFPPLSPPSGPKSIIQSAHFITSKLCSIQITECPFSIKASKDVSSLFISCKCNPVVGSSNIKIIP